MASTSKKQTASGSKNKSESARKAAATRAAKLEEQRRERETRGVLCIALGVVLGAYLFASASGVLGKFLSEVLFGLFGWPAYVLPILCIFAGIMIIRGSRVNDFNGSDWVFFAGMWDIVTLFQLARNLPYHGEEYFAFMKAAYQEGVLLRRGGGGIGAIMCYPLQQLGGSILAYTILIAFLLIVIIMVTRLSLREVGERVSHGVQTVAHTAAQSAAQIVKKSDRKLFVFEVVEEDPEEEFDNPFLPEHKRRPHSDLEGFDAAAAAFYTNSDPIPVAEKPRTAARSTARTAKETPLPHPVSDLPAEPLSLEETGISMKPLKRNRKQEPAIDPLPLPKAAAPVTVPLPTGDVIWDELESDPTSITVNPVASAVEPQPFAPLTNSFEVPSFLPGAMKDEPKEAPVPGFIAEPPMPQPAKKPAAKKPRAAQPKPEPAAEEPAIPEIIVEQPPAYVPPSFSLLNPPAAQYGTAGENPAEAAKILVDTFASFNIAVKILDYSVGPVITRFELQPAPGVRVSRITGLSNDIALALAASRVRIEAPIPGKAAVGIEIPNKTTIPVVLREIVESREFQKATSPITMAFGKDIAGKVVTADLAKMPHLLIAGATGSGKSVCINDLIISMVYKSSPADLRMILIDPKVVELKVYSTLPHLLIPVVTDPKKAAGALRWAVNEMMQRYKKFSELGARDLARFNELQKTEETKLPKLVVIIDELADLMMVAPDDVEDSICRIAQLGRAAGIHLIVATQRPSADIITGLIKANIPSRCAFAVSSGIDSRIILDATGAEKLLGKGDMLFHPNGSGKPTRLQCAFVSDEEVERITDYFNAQPQQPQFDEKFISEVTNAAKGGPTGGAFGEGKQEDELLGEAVRIVLESGSASISMIQRRLRVGYARAARLIDMMEQSGYVSGFDGSKPRRVLIKQAEYERIFCGVEEDEPAEEEEAVFDAYTAYTDYSDAADDFDDDAPFDMEDMEP